MLSADQLALLGASRIAAAAFAKAKPALCTRKPINTVVLPARTSGEPIHVYFLSPQPDLRSIELGGNYRVDVAADGRVVGARAFTRSCLRLPFKPPSRGGGPAALVVTHLLDPAPTEIHVFAAAVAHVPVLVVTGPPSPRIFLASPDGITPDR